MKKFKPILILEVSAGEQWLSYLYDLEYEPYYMYNNMIISANKAGAKQKSSLTIFIDVNAHNIPEIMIYDY